MEEKKEQPERRNEGPLKDEDVPQHPDKKIQQDFPGYPHNPSRYEVINPSNREEEETADLHEKDGEKINYTSDREKTEDNDEDDGSGGAFDATEEVKE